MTLFRQLYALLFSLFILVIATTGYVQFTETQDFLRKQMESDLNNASHSLGLMLAPALESGDNATAETLVNVIFEGGYYQQVILTWNVDGHQQVWENKLVIEGVPQWFIALDLFDIISNRSTITSGWLQLAELEITAHPGFGYHELWRILSNMIILFSILFLFAIIIARYGLGWILKPLHEISVHAKHIAQRQFGPEMALPKTEELKELVTAFNSMSSQLKLIFDSLDEEVTALRKKNLMDHVSGLPNRQYMMGRLGAWVSEPNSGAFFLVKMDWLDEVHHKFGFEVRDETIRILAEALQQELTQISDSVICRIAAYEFSFMLADVDHEKIATYLQTLVRTINQEVAKAGCNPNEGFAIGIAQRHSDMTVSDILSQADNALQQAIQAHKVYHWFESDTKQLYTREQWRDELNTAITSDKFQFRWQEVRLNNDAGILQREIYCQLQLQGKTVHAGQFMPYIELLSLGSLLDRCLINSVATRGIVDKLSESVAINLTHQSLSDVQFHQWLADFLKKQKNPHNIAFDIPEAGVYSNPDACQALCKIIRDAGASFGIDHFGRQFGSMSYLQTLRPMYVKLDQSFAYYDESQHNSELCRALINVAKGLNINVIVTGIQELTQLQRFESLHTQAYQGFISPPQDIKED
ncbi:EAL domain-containing protein [Shewanella sp. NIFS-20-20]|uniref:bifunctional diguanylate cyclase/phosphodiesterase n=1 Tax=Shewanella sp. NIFS-20-20 TaxID=2853806 RepID=UPI001C44F591|nr:EAL domain-containing protein [Shewanella sp. NIFS-20-20]MBV7317158.1 EAL domain-containing protein [Shewanella sp. NIFS-20-20]